MQIGPKQLLAQLHSNSRAEHGVMRKKKSFRTLEQPRCRLYLVAHVGSADLPWEGLHVQLLALVVIRVPSPSPARSSQQRCYRK